MHHYRHKKRNKRRSRGQTANRCPSCPFFGGGSKQTEPPALPNSPSSHASLDTWEGLSRLYSAGEGPPLVLLIFVIPRWPAWYRGHGKSFTLNNIFKFSLPHTIWEGQKVMGRTGHALGILSPGSPKDLRHWGDFGVSVEVAVKAWNKMEELDLLSPSPQFQHYSGHLHLCILTPQRHHTII